MGTCTRRLPVRAALVALLLGPAPAPADDEAVRRVGRIDRVAPEERRIVINDARYRLVPWARVHLARGRPGRVGALRPGTWVEFEVEGEGASRSGRVRELWVLPGPPPASTE